MEGAADSMNFRDFFKRFALVSALVVVAVTQLTKVMNLEADQNFIMICWAVIAGLTLLVAYGSLKAMDDGAFARFQGFFMGGVMGKVLISGILFAIYAYTVEEKHMMVVVPFAVIYVPYLILETTYLAKASRLKGATTVKKKDAAE